MLAFADVNYRTVYLADERAVRPVGNGEFALSPDGRFLLLLECHRPPLKPGIAFNKGSRITLHDRRTRKRRSTKLPFDIPETALSDQADASVHPVHDAAAYVAIYFGDRTVTIGPISNEYWIWGAAGWMRAKERPGELARRLRNPYTWTGSPVMPRPELISLRDPIRTVWVRPDGSTLEVLRQNDLPGRIVGNVVSTPLIFLNPLGLLGWLANWQAISDDWPR